MITYRRASARWDITTNHEIAYDWLTKGEVVEVFQNGVQGTTWTPDPRS